MSLFLTYSSFDRYQEYNRSKISGRDMTLSLPGACLRDVAALPHPPSNGIGKGVRSSTGSTANIHAHEFDLTHHDIWKRCRLDGP